MAYTINKVILVGRLGRDPEVRYTSNSMPVASFSIATDESWKDKSGNRQTRTEWHNIVAWGKLGELCGEYLSKGRQVYIEGRLQTREWQGKDNQNHRTTEIVARDVVFLDSKGASQQDGAHGSSGTSGGRPNAPAPNRNRPAAAPGQLPEEPPLDDFQGPPMDEGDEIPF